MIILVALAVFFTMVAAWISGFFAYKKRDGIGGWWYALAIGLAFVSVALASAT